MMFQQELNAAIRRQNHDMEKMTAASPKLFLYLKQTRIVVVAISLFKATTVIVFIIHIVVTIGIVTTTILVC